MPSARRLGAFVSEFSGGLADLGVMVPIAAALVVTNGLDPGTLLVGVGALYLASGLYFRVPVPVQPVKAASAVAIALALRPETISSAGLLLGALLVVLAVTRATDRLARLFALPVVRGLQFGVGAILLVAAARLVPAGSGAAPWVIVAAVAGALAVGARGGRRLPIVLVVVVLSAVGGMLVTGGSVSLRPELWTPVVSTKSFDPAVLWMAFTLLVVPQIPLTFGNAVVAVADLERAYFGERARRADPTSVSLSAGLGNIAVGALGGMPMCHGSSGLTAHYRAGARTHVMNVAIGGSFLALGLFFGPTAFDVLALVPLPVLAGLLAFTGLFHCALIADQRGFDLAVAGLTGVVGFVTGNLAVALAAGLVTYWPVRWAARTPLPERG